MKLKEASEIVSAIFNWQLVAMGVKEREEISHVVGLDKYSLEDLLKANKLVATNNDRKRSLQQYHSSKGRKTKGVSVQMILAERTIAAVYTALNFKPNGEMVALINDVAVGCVKADYSE